MKNSTNPFSLKETEKPRHFDASTAPPYETDLEEPRQLYILLVISGFLVVLFLLWGRRYWRTIRGQGVRRRARDHDSDDEPQILGGRGWLRIGFLIKRCDQTSTREIEDRILERLQRNCRVVERSWKRDLDDGQRPVIVFCVISSRIGTDIENAMRGVHGSSTVILVVLHSVLKNLLRGDLSDDEELLDPTTRKRMTGIAHFAFSDREGLYICRQNDIGFDTLVDVVRSLV